MIDYGPGRGRRRRRRRPRHGAIRLSLRLYRALLWLFPPSLRRAHGEEMAQLFRDNLRDETAHHGPPGALRAWAATLTDLAVSLPREWPREWSRELWRGRRLQFSRGTARHHAYTTLVGHPVSRRTGSGELTMQGKFDKFTERARRVLSLAQEEAQRFNHNYIGTEHLLLGLLREGDGVAAKVLVNLGVELEKARNAVEFIIGRGDRIVLGEVGLTPRSKKVIELAVDEARRLNHHYVGAEHILLGLIREGEGIAAGVLESLGVNLEKVRTATMQVLNQGGSAGANLTYPRPRVPAEFGKFTERARKALGDAITEARARDQREVTTAHALLALARDADGLAAQTLTRAGVSLEALRRTLEQELGPVAQSGEPTPRGPVMLDTHTLRVIALAAEEARLLNDRFVGPEHLLLGILSEADGLGGQTLLAQSVDMTQLRRICAQVRADIATARIRRPEVTNIALGCLDVAATAAFYVQSFGATQAGATEDGESIVRFPNGGLQLFLRAAPAEQILAGAPIQIGVAVGDAALLWRTLKDTGVAGLSEIHGEGASRWFTVPDPDSRTVRVQAADDRPH